MKLVLEKRRHEDVGLWKQSRDRAVLWLVESSHVMLMLMIGVHPARRAPLARKWKRSHYFPLRSVRSHRLMTTTHVVPEAFHAAALPPHKSEPNSAANEI